LEEIIEAFENNADAFLSGGSANEDKITWRDFCQYVFGAAESE